MTKRKPKTRLSGIMETLKVADLRLRIAPDLPEPTEHRELAIIELEVACAELRLVIKDVRRGKYP